MDAKASCSFFVRNELAVPPGGSLVRLGHACWKKQKNTPPQVPTGELAPVLGTFFDFSEEKTLGAAIDGVGGDPPGLDHCVVRVGTSDDGRAEVRSQCVGRMQTRPG